MLRQTVLLSTVMTLLRALKMKFLSSCALFSLLMTAVARAFAPLTSADTTGCVQFVTVTRLFLSSPYNDDALARNKARTDVCNFLTQRAMQSFIHLLIETRDPHTVTWMEEFGGWTNLEEFHGTGALNLTIYPKWDSVLLEMMEQPPAVVVIRAKRRGRGHGGWSKNNPYLEVRTKQDATYFIFTCLFYTPLIFPHSLTHSFMLLLLLLLYIYTGTICRV